jgi:HEAT repeat protein
MKGRVAILVLFVLASSCEKETQKVPELPPPPEKTAVRNPVEEIGRALLEGSAEEKKKALSVIASLDDATRKQHQAALNDLLRHCLSGEDPAVRREAALVYVKMEGGAGGLVESLDLVPEGDEEVLGVALEAIEEALKSADSTQRLRSVDMLSEIGKPAVGLLLKTLQDENAEVRLGALDALWAIGPVESGFAERLSALQKDPDPRVRQAAAAAVERLKEGREEKPSPAERDAPARPGGD